MKNIKHVFSAALVGLALTAFGAHADVPPAAPACGIDIAQVEGMIVEAFGVSSQVANAFKPLSPADFATFDAWVKSPDASDEAKAAEVGATSIVANIIYGKGVIIATLDANGCVTGFGEIDFDGWAKIFGKPAA